MEKLRVTFYNTRLNSNSQERVEDLLKDFYWNQAKENWRNFNGDIRVQWHQSRGGDCALVFVSKEWKKWTIDFLRNAKNVRFIEIELTNGNFQDVRDLIFRDDQKPESYQIGEFIQI